MSIGIDLGTCSSLVAINKEGKVAVLQNQHGKNTTPSYVSYINSDIVVGDIAKANAPKNIEKVVYGVKRIIGKNFDDPTVGEDIKRWPFEVINKNNFPYIKVEHDGENLELLPQEISAEVLKCLKKMAEEQLKEINNVVLTVPAHFTPSQTSATEEAAKLAGLKNVKILKEPIAAALAYSEYRMKEEDHKILIYDFGGGTFDVSVVGFRGKSIELIATSGDGHLGGEDLTNVLYEYFYEKFKENNDGKEANPKSKASLRKACESAKIELSGTEETEVDCNILHIGDVDGSITRSTFNNLSKDLINRTISIVENMLNTKKIKKEDIGAIILAGGSSRIPLVKDKLEEEFKGIPVFKTINPDEAIVYGATFYANLIGKNDPNLPQIIDVIEEVFHPSVMTTPKGRVRKVSLSPPPIFNSREREENKDCAAIGIDLGTTTSLACFAQMESTTLIGDSYGKNEVPSCIFYNSENEKIMGLTAINKAVTDVKSFVYDIKRIIGRKMRDKTVENLVSKLNYKIEADNSDNPIISFDHKNPKFTKTPEQVSADVLLYLKENIEKKLNGKKYKVVLTVPANFTDSQRSATQAAADLAGLNVLQLINEPTAAAIAYGMTNNFDDKENTIVVYDFGGGTFDVSIIKVKGKEIELIGSDGDENLGGADLTQRVYDYFLQKYKEKTGMDSINPKASHNLRKRCEEAKINLSAMDEVDVEWSLLETYHIDKKLTRNLFQELNKDLFERTITILEKTMKSNNVRKESIDEIVLVGGSSKIPYVVTAISNFLPGVKISQAINPIEAVAKGAAILADDLLRNGENAIVYESEYVYPPSAQSIEVPSLPLPSQSSSSSSSCNYSSSSKSFNKSFSIKEKVSHSYGVLVTDGDTKERRIDRIIERGSVIPCTIKKPYFTAPNYSKTKISVYEGEDTEVKPGNFLQEFIFRDITKSPEGTEIEVEFTINKNGMLVVTAIDKSDPTHVKIVEVKIKK